mmetsp:Transcript_26169/g.83611  ORF Transcript_26169/g.83611 Transcript_26169/m.83611 type:complete len:292 (+) Transcript_26169:238-1113(+)
MLSPELAGTRCRFHAIRSSSDNQSGSGPQSGTRRPPQPPSGSKSRMHAMKGSAIGLLMYLAVAVAPLPSHADGRAEGGGTWEDRGEEGEGGEGIGRHAGRSLQQVWNPLASGSGATKPVKRRAAAGPVKYGQFDKPNMCMGAPLPWRPFAKGGIGDLHAQGLYTEPSKPARAAKKRPLPKSKPASVGMEARTGDGSAEQGEGGETGMDAGGEGAKSDGESDAEGGRKIRRTLWQGPTGRRRPSLGSSGHSTPTRSSSRQRGRGARRGGSGPPRRGAQRRKRAPACGRATNT